MKTLVFKTIIDNTEIIYKIKKRELWVYDKRRKKFTYDALFKLLGKALV